MICMQLKGEFRMERLTKKFIDGTTNIVNIFDIKQKNWCEINGRYANSAYTGEAIDKLSEYEDIGLTPEEIKYFLKDFGISLLVENRLLKKQHKEDEEIISKMANRIKGFEAKYFND